MYCKKNKQFCDFVLSNTNKLKKAVRLNIFLLLIFSIKSNTGFSQNYVTTIGQSKSTDGRSGTENRQNLIQNYIMPVQGNIFYSENNPSNRYIYSFYPDFPMTLGRGIEPNKLQETKFSPLAEITRDTVDGKRPLSTTADIYLVSNKDELKKVFDLDVKMSVRCLGFKASSALNIVNTYNFDQNNIMVVIKGQSEFSRIALKNPRLSEDAKAILSKNGYNEFVRLYGSNIVSVERRGVSVYFLITINNVTSSMKNSINASLDAGGGFGPVSGKLEMKLKQEISQKSQKEDLNIRFISFGGDGLSSFSSIIDSLKSRNNSFEGIKKQLSETLKNYSTIEKSVPIGYLVTPISNIPSVFVAKAEDSYSAMQEKYLSAVSEKYYSNLNKLTVFQEIINQTHPISWYTSAVDLQKINKALPVQKEYVERLRNLHDTILNHFDAFKNKPESDIENCLVIINSEGKTILQDADSIIESKYLNMSSTINEYTFSGYGIKGLNYYLQGELSDYTQSENINGIEFKKSSKIFEITSMAQVNNTIQSEIMGTINTFKIQKSELKGNLENGAKTLKGSNADFGADSKEYKYFSITCIISSVFGKQIRIPIGYVLYSPNQDSYKVYLRPELNYQTSTFINQN